VIENDDLASISIDLRRTGFAFPITSITRDFGDLPPG
jgi:hypothetical protein